MTKRTRTLPRLEWLEGRRLLSTITGFTEFPVPSSSANPNSIASGPDGNLWFTDSTNNAIGVATLSSTPKAAGRSMNAGIMTAGTSDLAVVASPFNSSIPIPTLVPLALEDTSFVNSLVKDKNRHA